MSKKQDELPGMPEKTPLQKECEKFISIFMGFTELEIKLSEQKDVIMQKLKDERQTAIVYDGYKFEIKKSDIKLKVSHLNN